MVAQNGLKKTFVPAINFTTGKALLWEISDPRGGKKPEIMLRSLII